MFSYYIREPIFQNVILLLTNRKEKLIKCDFVLYSSQYILPIITIIIILSVHLSLAFLNILIWITRIYKNNERSVTQNGFSGFSLSLLLRSIIMIYIVPYRAKDFICLHFLHIVPSLLLFVFVRNIIK